MISTTVMIPRQQARRALCVMVMSIPYLLCGCTKSPPAAGPVPAPAQPVPAPAQPAPAAPKTVDVEELVRTVITKQFGVPAGKIAMDRPLSDPPLSADELDMVELVMELEDRLNITIPDEALEKRSKATKAADVVRITPADLVKIVRKAQTRPGKAR